MLEAIEARVADQKRSWEHYLQDQYELVEDYQVAEKNGYILYVVAEDADRIVTQFIAAVK